MHFRWLESFLIGVALTAVDRQTIEKIRQAKIDSGASNATVNRVLALLRSVLRRACQDWEWIERVPYFRMMREPTRRIRFLTQQEAIKLLHELPPHLADMAAFTLSTGLRRANVTGLRWDQVNLTMRQAWIHPDQAKARKPIAVPLNNDAYMVLARQVGKHPTNVFQYEGKPITQVSTVAWYKALKRCDIDNFRWHDLRHTWASWHAQAGTPLFVLQELGGWESAEMVRRYAHLGISHLSNYAQNIILK
jgi:integrase